MLQTHQRPAEIGADMSSAVRKESASDDLRLSELATTAHQLVSDTSRPLHRISIHLDGASVEMEWDARDQDRLDDVRPTDGIAPDAPLVQETDPSAAAAMVVRSPLVGTFYLAPAPGEQPFVAVGATVDPDTVIGIVEAMKLLNRITAGHHGIVRSVLLPDRSPVEFDQPLVLLDPAGDEDETAQDGEH
jgi:acetyl-CoA carboxylase biotin carboxyl carrier protein